MYSSLQVRLPKILFPDFQKRDTFYTLWDPLSLTEIASTAFCPHTHKYITLLYQGKGTGVVQTGRKHYAFEKIPLFSVTEQLGVLVLTMVEAHFSMNIISAKNKQTDKTMRLTDKRKNCSLIVYIAYNILLACILRSFSSQR